MSNPILSWRRVRALCVKETRQIVRGKDMSLYGLEDYTVVRHVMVKH